MQPTGPTPAAPTPFGRTLGWYRDKTGRGVAELAGTVGVAEADVLAWERGDAPPPDVATVDRLEAALDLPAKTLLYSLAWPILPASLDDVDAHQLWRLCTEARDVLAWAADDGAPVVGTRWIDEGAATVEVRCGAPLVTVPVELAPELEFSVEPGAGDDPPCAVFRCSEHGHRIVLPV